MSYLRIFALFFTATLIFSAPSIAVEKAAHPEKIWIRLTDCVDKNLGYRIKCSPDWDLDIKPNSLHFLVIGDTEKIVTVNITKSGETGLTWSDLKPSKLKYVYGYSDHFKVAKTKIGQYRALKVEAGLSEYPKVRILDYFVLKNTRLYRIRCTVNSKEYFKKYESFFSELISTFQFFDSTESMITYNHETDR